MLELDRLAARYGVLPSTIARESVEDFALDMLVASVGAEEDAKQAEQSAAKLGRRRA